MKTMLLLALLLTGCASEPKVVYIPTKCPAPIVSPAPAYPKIDLNANAADFAKWCIITNKICRSHDEDCMIKLEGYK